MRLILSDMVGSLKEESVEIDTGEPDSLYPLILLLFTTKLMGVGAALEFKSGLHA